MHIPKTGGSAVEYAGQRAGHAWGRFDTFYDAVGRGNEDKVCGSPWHEPFQYNLWPAIEQTSFCVIREPVDKLLSEFNFRIGVAECHKEGLEAWIVKKVKGLYSKDRHGDDCHLLASVDFAQGCDYPVPYDSKHNGLKLLLQHTFNVSVTFNHDAPPVSVTKDCSATKDWLSKESLDIINEVYEADFDLFRHNGRESSHDR